MNGRRKPFRDSGAWYPGAVHFYELDALTTAIDLHKFQLQQLTAHEIQEATRTLIAEPESARATMLRVNENPHTIVTYRENNQEMQG